jgi:hypothetical protein
MSRSTTETLVRILGLYYLAEGGIDVLSRLSTFIEEVTGDDGQSFPFWWYFYGVFTLAMGVFVLLYSKPLARWMHREDAEASDA